MNAGDGERAFCWRLFCLCGREHSVRSILTPDSSGVELARTIYIYGVYTVFLAGKSPNVRSYTVYIYGSGQPYSGGFLTIWSSTVCAAS